jgi:hypothetical protein
VEVFVSILYFLFGRLFTADYLPHTERALDFVFYAFGYHLTGWYGCCSTKHLARGAVHKSLLLVVLIRFSLYLGLFDRYTEHWKTAECWKMIARKFWDCKAEGRNTYVFSTL